MSSHLVRRGGIWWARLVVPTRLREAAGRREFIQSCRTHELAIAKLVAAVFLADWRRLLLRIESVPMSIDVLKLVEGSPLLTGGGWATLAEAEGLSGISQIQLLRAVAGGSLKLFCRLVQVVGHDLPFDSLELTSPEAGLSGGVVIPQSKFMPLCAIEATRGGVLPVYGSAAIASDVLAERPKAIEIHLFEVPDRAGMVFAPEVEVRVRIDQFEVLCAGVELIRQRIRSQVSEDALDRAQALQKTVMLGEATSAGKKAHKLFSDAVSAYIKDPSGLPRDLNSTSEQRQREKGLLLFAEFMGDLPLKDIDSDKLREFRDDHLRTFPAKANNLPKELRRESMKATVGAIRAAGVEWPLMSLPMQHERILWLARLFSWLCAKEWLKSDPTVSLRRESGLTKAERKELKREIDPEDEGRGPFEPSELKAIFGQSWFKTGNGLHIKKPGYWYPFEYWLPLLGLYAGCRIKEAAQLYISDVKLVGSEVWCLDINENTKDKSVKNDQSKRLVPLYPKLIELGFLDYCERLRKEGYKRVFPELTCSKSDAKYAKEPIRKMSQMLGRLGMPRDLMHVFHCLRHNMNNGLLRVPLASLPFADEGLKKYIRYTVMGHEVGNDVNTQHYTTANVSEMAALVGGLTYELPEIANFDIDFAIGQISVALRKKKGFRKGREDMGPLTSE